MLHQLIFIPNLPRVEESDYFERDGADVYTEAEISVSQAILGGTLTIEGIYEDQIVEVRDPLG